MSISRCGLAPRKPATTSTNGSSLSTAARSVNEAAAGLTATRAGIADYRFIKALGAGNYGVFYLAHCPERLPVAAELVAVKVLGGTSSQDTFRRAIREFSAFAAIDSPYL